MKMIIAALALVAVAAAASVPEQDDAILRSKYDQTPDGGYEFSYETEKGNVRSEIAEPKEVLDEENKPHTILSVRGSYGYKDTEGNVENINYFADETGYHAEGPSVPKNSRR